MTADDGDGNGDGEGDGDREGDGDGDERDGIITAIVTCFASSKVIIRT